jgi:hypothetical protein
LRTLFTAAAILASLKGTIPVATLSTSTGEVARRCLESQEPESKSSHGRAESDFLPLNHDMQP